MGNFTYEIFHEVAKQENFGKAAEALMLTPSAVSHSIAAFEKELGFSLFTRNKRGVTITEEGKQVLPHVREILRSEQLMREEAAEITGLTRGKVTVATFSAFCAVWMPDIILSFGEKYPGIELTVLQEDYEEIYGSVFRGEATIGITSLSGRTTVQEYPIMEDTFYCVTPRNVAPRNGKVFTARELEDYPLISTVKGFRSDMDRYFQENDLHPTPRYYFYDDGPVLSFVEKGLGIHFISDMNSERGEYDVNRFTMDPPFTRVIGLITQKNAVLSPAGRAMKKEILEMVGL